MWEKLLAVNLLGPQRCTVAAVPWLREARGAVVNTASIAGIRGNGSSTVYCATKAALINLTREHARALGPEIRVNAIAPGTVDSNWECRFERPESFVHSIPLQRRGLPDDYAEVILFLCAGAAYVTGETIVVDGGLTAGPGIGSV
jgi:3-oxoacyl-[acyl-carrier protein] reductase